MQELRRADALLLIQSRREETTLLRPQQAVVVPFGPSPAGKRPVRLGARVLQFVTLRELQSQHPTARKFLFPESLCLASRIHPFTELPAGLGPTVVADLGLGAPHVAPDLRRVLHADVFGIQPVGARTGEQAAAAPGASFAIERDGLEPRSARNRRPRFVLALWLAAEGEVDEVATIGRKIAAVLVDAALQPLPRGEFIGAAVPEDRADLLGRPAPDHHRHRGFAGKDHMEAGWGCGFHAVFALRRCSSRCPQTPPPHAASGRRLAPRRERRLRSRGSTGRVVGS